MSSTTIPAVATKLLFRTSLTRSDPRLNPVTIVGQLDHLKKLTFDLVKCKLEPRVNDEKHFMSCLESLSPSPTDSVSLYMNYAQIVALPGKCSRHNAPSRAHSLSKVIKNYINHVENEYILVTCPRSYVLPYVAAISRAFPLFSLKTNSTNNNNGKKNASETENGESIKTEQQPKESKVTVEFLLTDEESGTDIGTGSVTLNDNDLELIEDVSFGVRNAAKITDMPPNLMNTDRFLEESIVVMDLLKKADINVSMTVIRGEELEKKGFGGLWNVGKGAANPPALVVLSYKPSIVNDDNSTKQPKNIAWVGKGIVFDTGGLSIKSKTGMCGMKMDCGGAAAVLNAFYVAVKKGTFQDNLHAVLCLAENAVSERAYRVDDIITLYSGKTVEINNTDAEGRLVLGDGVAYAKKDLQCDIIVDMATLTGAQGISTGKYHAAVLTNTESYEKKLVDAGRSSGDLTFPMVFAPELHFSEFNSNIADMKNSVGDRANAQASCAGLFIFSHIGFDFNGVWVHIDMASPVETNDRATGYGVLLLNTLFGNGHSINNLFKEIAPQTKDNN